CCWRLGLRSRSKVRLAATGTSICMRRTPRAGQDRYQPAQPDERDGGRARLLADRQGVAIVQWMADGSQAGQRFAGDPLRRPENPDADRRRLQQVERGNNMAKARYLTLSLIAAGAVLAGCAQPNPNTAAGRSDTAGQQCAVCMATNPGDYWACHAICVQR